MSLIFLVRFCRHKKRPHYIRATEREVKFSTCHDISAVGPLKLFYDWDLFGCEKYVYNYASNLSSTHSVLHGEHFMR